MKKIKYFVTVFLLMFVLVLGGCTGSSRDYSQQTEDEEDTLTQEEIDAAFEDELTPLEGDELAMMEDSDDAGYSEEDELTPFDESEMESDEEEMIEDIESEQSGDKTDDTSENTSDDGNSGAVKVKEDGTYTSREEVAVYIHTYGHLPSNYITKSEAKELGWVSSEGNLDEVVPGKSIGGDKFGNYDKMLPEEDGRTYQECDVDYDGGTRNAKRIVFSNDGLIFYTEDHYETFEQLY